MLDIGFIHLGKLFHLTTLLIVRVFVTFVGIEILLGRVIQIRSRGWMSDYWIIDLLNLGMSFYDTC